MVPWFNKLTPGFLYSSVQCNKGYGASLHVDGNNAGPSAIVSLGNHSGGGLWVWDDKGDTVITAEKDVAEWCKKGDRITGRVLDIHDRLTIIDGCRPHQVMPFDGERYSLVFFCASSCRYATVAQKAELTNLGFRVPEARTLDMMRTGMGIYQPVILHDPGNLAQPIERRFVEPGKIDQARRERFVLLGLRR